MPECRICKQQIDKEKDDWVMPSRNYYFHRECYHDWKKTEPLVDEEWKPFIYDFISRDLKVSYNHMYIENLVHIGQKESECKRVQSQRLNARCARLWNVLKKLLLRKPIDRRRGLLI